MSHSYLKEGRRKGKDYNINPRNSRTVIKILIHVGSRAKDNVLPSNFTHKSPDNCFLGNNKSVCRKLELFLWQLSFPVISTFQYCFIYYVIGLTYCKCWVLHQIHRNSPFRCHNATASVCSGRFCI